MNNERELTSVEKAGIAALMGTGNPLHREAMTQALWHLGNDGDRAIIVDRGEGWKTDIDGAASLLRAALAAAGR
jgi:hypothetical protein